MSNFLTSLKLQDHNGSLKTIYSVIVYSYAMVEFIKYNILNMIIV